MQDRLRWALSHRPADILLSPNRLATGSLFDFLLATVQTKVIDAVRILYELVTAFWQTYWALWDSFSHFWPFLGHSGSRLPSPRFQECIDLLPMNSDFDFCFVELLTHYLKFSNFVLQPDFYLNLLPEVLVFEYLSVGYLTKHGFHQSPCRHHRRTIRLI